MTWSDFYLICFIVGFVLSLLSFSVGVLHLNLPGHWDDFLHVQGHGHGPFAHAPHGSGSASSVSPYNFPTLMAFLAWFGGAGYLLTHYYRFWFLLGFAVAVGAGLTGATLVFWFLVKVLMARDYSMNPADYDLIGVLGTVNSGIRPGGTGEIIYSQGGTRRTVGARSEDGLALPKGSEVVITHYEKGIAYVRRWEDVAKE